jgi:ABC1 atypical kinase-like domain
VIFTEWTPAYVVKGVEAIRLRHEVEPVKLLHAGDPHPANMLVRRHPENGAMQVVLLDHGLYRYDQTEALRDRVCGTFGSALHTTPFDEVAALAWPCMIW